IRGHARPVALETGRSADEHVARGCVAVIGQRVGDVAWSERELAGALDRERWLRLEDEFAFEHLKGLVEVVRVQRRRGGLRWDLDLGHGHLAAGLLAAQQDVGTYVWHGAHDPAGWNS